MLAGSVPGGFDYSPRTRLIFGPGAISQLGELANELGARRAMIVTDRGIVVAGHAQRAADLLTRAGIASFIFDEVHENPTTADVARCVSSARSFGCDLFLGLGGGSSMDTAKGANFILTNGGRMQDYWGVGKARLPMLPLIAIPTTAGTGSECQSAALIADEVTHQKMACLDPKAAARIAILDPELTVSQPMRVTAVTGIDALAHALETAVTTRRSPFSSVFSHEAWRLGKSAFMRVIKNPTDLDARSSMLLAAAYAGTAIENSMLGAAHAAANPLTARFEIVHGAAVGLMMPAVLRYNAVDPKTFRIYSQLSNDPDPVASLAGVMSDALKMSGLPTGLRAAGVTEDSIPQLAAEAAQQWTARFNPVPIDAPGFEQLYRSAMG